MISFAFSSVVLALWNVPLGQLPKEASLGEFPGSFDPDLPPTSLEVFTHLMFNFEWLRSLKDRTLAIMLVNSAVILLCGVLLPLVFLSPWVLVGVVWFAVGPIAGSLLVYKILALFIAGVNALLVVAQSLWAPWARTIAQVRLSMDESGDFRLLVATMWKDVAAAHQGGRRAPQLWCDGRLLTFESIDAESDIADAFALATYCLWMPSRWQPFSTVGFAVGILAYLSIGKVQTAVRRAFKTSFIALKALLILNIVLFTGSDRIVMLLTDVIGIFVTILLAPVILLFHGWEPALVWKLARKTALLWFLRAVHFGMQVALLVPRESSEAKGFSKADTKLRAMLNNAIMDFTRGIDKISVPNFIRSLPTRFDAEAINEAQQLLASLGWPEAPKVDLGPPRDAPANFDQFAHAYIGQTNIRQGIARVDLELGREMQALAGFAPEYKRSEQYATLEAELESLSRYFEQPDLNIPDLSVDDIWPLVSDIFANSRLTPFGAIVRKWEKKYGLGPFWGFVNPKTGKWRKLSRRTFIASVGGWTNFLNIWARTFEIGHTIPQVSAVSIKSEALPEKKWRNGIVRTIISSPIAHYVSSTLWNYAPNHNFKFWSTSIKIGMPLNGINLSTLVAQHDTYDYHFEGDFSAFDSTVAKGLAALIAKVRKKGFERHRDFSKICFLIDANYHGLLNQPLMTTSTGILYSKVTGLSTGHSSTGMDNSLAVDILYIIAWKRLTGLSAHEFRFFNKLSNYGDDHLLSWLASAPPTWTPANIIKEMARMGVVLRDERPLDRPKSLADYAKLDNLTFLSKMWRRPSDNDKLELLAAGVPVPTWIVFHSPEKLVGKAYAPARKVTLAMKRNYRAKRLISYLQLTAHSREVYNKLRADLDRLLTLKGGQRVPAPIPVPSYEDVLRLWYDPESHLREEDEDPSDTVNDEMIIDYSMDGFADTLTAILSVVPDVVNPIIYNIGYTDYLISLFGERVSWPVELLRRSNGVSGVGQLTVVGKRTYYDFLFDSPRVLTAPVTATDEQLISWHWYYYLARAFIPKFTTGQLLAWADKKLASANFVVNGHVQTYVKRLDVPLLEILLLVGVRLIPALPVPGFVKYIQLPSFSQVAEYFYGWVLNKFWSKVPANMKESDNALSRIGAEQPTVLLEAPTGTGKSTTFVNHVARYHSFKFDRVILVAPRKLLVETLAPYLRSAFGLVANVVTEGSQFDISSRLILTTPMEVFLHESWLQENNLFLVDEAHLNEPHTLAIQHVLRSLRKPTVLMTATPSAANVADCNVHVKLAIASTWTITDDASTSLVVSEPLHDYETYWRHYRATVLDIVRSRTLAKILVFVNKKSEAIALASATRRKCSVLTSAHREVPSDVEVIYATSVADVGVTLPDVTWVVTSNITITQRPGDEQSALIYIKADPLLLRQRRGRTGRTSNGVFSLVDYPNALFVQAVPDWQLADIGYEVLKSTSDPSTVARFFPQAFTKLLGKDTYDREDDATIDELTKTILTVAKAFEATDQKTYRATMDGLAETQYWHFSYNTANTDAAVEGPGGTKQPRPLWYDEGWRHILGIALDSWSRRYALEEAHVRHYLRHWALSWDNWRKYTKTLNKGESSIEPTARFGTRHAALNTSYEFKTNDTVWADMPGYDRPAKREPLPPPPKPRTVFSWDEPAGPEPAPPPKKSKNSMFW